MFLFCNRTERSFSVRQLPAVQRDAFNFKRHLGYCHIKQRKAEKISRTRSQASDRSGEKKEAGEEPRWPSLDLILLLKVRSGRQGTHVGQQTETTSLQRPGPSTSRIKHSAGGPCSEADSVFHRGSSNSVRWTRFPNVRLFNVTPDYLLVAAVHILPDADSINALQNVLNACTCT